ncbi:MAG: putative quinol monooxygenase [Marinifilaceae bacterium]
MKEVVVIFAIIKANIGSEEILFEELLKLVVLSKKEIGNISYELHRDNNDPSMFIMHEVWEDAKAIEKHMNSIHFSAFKLGSVNILDSLSVKETTKV